MAVGSLDWPVIHAIEGIRLGTASAGIKKVGRRDLLIMEIVDGASVAGVFTQNAFAAAPVLVCKAHLAQGSPRYLLVNSGCANACTGPRGLENALECCRMVADTAGVSPEQVIPFSTGVIGEYLPMEKIRTVIPESFAELDRDGWRLAAEAIMTTDTCPKGASYQFEYGGELITVSGIAKGAGMIRPNMATLLTFIGTDAAVGQDVLEKLLKLAADKSFNRISIDGDTSTNDSCILIATGRIDLPELTSPGGHLFDALLNAVTIVMQQLAKNIIRDGEGVTKFVEVKVSGGVNEEECLQAAYAIAHSPLVKTAIYASDANWGRIVAAIGYAGIPGLAPAGVQVWLDNVKVVSNGGRAPEYRDEAGAAVVSRDEFSIKVDLGRGLHEETIWTSDLSHDYVTINAEYRT